MKELTKREYKRIFSKIDKNTDTGCWNYRTSLSEGYGRVFFRGKRYKAHRFFYNLLKGPLPKWKKKGDLEIDHICNNRCCVNPEHLRLVDVRTNVVRGKGPTAINARKRVCKHGHDALYKIGNRRRCRECRRLLDASPKRKAWRKAWGKAKYQSGRASISLSPQPGTR